MAGLWRKYSGRDITLHKLSTRAPYLAGVNGQETGDLTTLQIRKKLRMENSRTSEASRSWFVSYWHGQLRVFDCGCYACLVAVQPQIAVGIKTHGVCSIN